MAIRFELDDDYMEDHDRYEISGVESYEQRLERWKQAWRDELEDDLEHGR